MHIELSFMKILCCILFVICCVLTALSVLQYRVIRLKNRKLVHFISESINYKRLYENCKYERLVHTLGPPQKEGTDILRDILEAYLKQEPIDIPKEEHQEEESKDLAKEEI